VLPVVISWKPFKRSAHAPLVDCPACQAPELKKMLSMPGFRLSGTGWYETDFKTGSKKNLAGGEQS
jgi:predicted nucleic acid-binding Zn ribbon protein